MPFSSEIIRYRCCNEYCEHEFFDTEAEMVLVYEADDKRFGQDEYEPRCPICGDECIETI